MLKVALPPETFLLFVVVINFQQGLNAHSELDWTTFFPLKDPASVLSNEKAGHCQVYAVHSGGNGKRGRKVSLCKV